jgi:hypothetical protein
MVKTKISVAKFLEQQIAMSDKPQREIAAECGYEKPNIMTMFKTGQTKVPLNKVGLIAKAINVDPIYMLKLVLSEYSPETWDAIEGILGQERLVSSQEMELLKFMRAVTGNVIPDISIRENRDILGAALKQASAKDIAKADAAIAAYNKLPKNAKGKQAA